MCPLRKLEDIGGALYRVVLQRLAKVYQITLAAAACGKHSNSLVNYECSVKLQMLVSTERNELTNEHFSTSYTFIPLRFV